MLLTSEKYTELQKVAKVNCKTRAEFASAKTLVIEYDKDVIIDTHLFPQCAKQINIVYSGNTKVDELDLRGYPALKVMSFHTVVSTSSGKTSMSKETKDGIHHTSYEWTTPTKLHDYLNK